MKLLGLDFETTGLDPLKDNVIEVGAVIWDTEKHCPLAMDNYFVRWPDTVVPPDITAINGVENEYVEEFGLSPSEGIARIMNLEYRTEANVAHNGEAFDHPFYRDWVRRVHGHYGNDARRLWIDTQNDIDYSEAVPTRKLTYLAAEHGFLNPFAHRAVFDVLTMMIILDKYPLSEIIYSAQQPTIMLQALVSYDDREKAKEARFRWDAPNKRWIRTIKAHKVEKENFQFKTRVVQP